MTGAFQGTAAFGGTTLVSGGNNDVFVAKISPAGSFDTIPGVPTGLTATAVDGSVNLVWTPPVDNGGAPVSGYTVQYSANEGPTWQTWPRTKTASATVTRLTSGSWYLFRVAAENKIGRGAYSSSTAAVP